MVVIMKIITKVGCHHIVENSWGLNVVSSTILGAIMLKSENFIIKYYVKSSRKIKIWNLLTNRLSKTFDVP